MKIFHKDMKVIQYIRLNERLIHPPDGVGVADVMFPLAGVYVCKLCWVPGAVAQRGQRGLIMSTLPFLKSALERGYELTLQRLA